MTDTEASRVTAEGFEFLCSQCAVIALLPLEDWLAALNRAESVAPVINPTLYRDYEYSNKAQFIKKLIGAAIPVKRLVIEMQGKIRESANV
jgi:hypothetical protein